MPLPDLTPEEYAEIVRLVRSAIGARDAVTGEALKKNGPTALREGPS